MSPRARLAIAVAGGILVAAILVTLTVYPSSSTAVTMPSLPAGATTCPTSGWTSNSNGSYGCETLLMNWNGVGFQPTLLALTVFDGVSFSIRGYNTMDCPVVNVTGVEPGGSSASFFIAPVPLNCQFATPTVFSPDHDFGATWGGGSPIQVFVRVA